MHKYMWVSIVYRIQVCGFAALNPNAADQSSLPCGISRNCKNAYAPPSLGEFKDFFDDFTYFIQKTALWEYCKSFS